MSHTNQTRESWTFNRILTIALLVRLFLVFYARIHDYFFEVSFTDIDYRVFSDAAKLVSEGKSPFDRATYRYTPFIAWILVPTVWIQDFGKILFCVIDCVTGYLLYKLTSIPSQSKRNSLSDDSAPPTTTALQESEKRKNASLRSFGVIVFWLFNPFVAIISARGSADSLVCCAVLFSLYLLEKKNEAFLAAIVHGALAVHLKIYPIIYLPSIFLFLANRDDFYDREKLKDFKCNTASRAKHFIWKCVNNQRGHIFVMLSGLFFCVTVAIGYLIYEAKFLEEFLFYHVTRRDIRHNFSPYFYPLYLAMGDDGEGSSQMSSYLSIGAFIPQITCILAFALKYYDDLPFCWFLTTFSFVSLNKVCTSQYFIWYLCFLPLIYNRIQITSCKFSFLTSLWFGGQGIWLFFAYLFEFCGLNTLPYVFAASLLFLFINCYIMGVIIRSYQTPKSKLVANTTDYLGSEAKKTK